ncbi:LYR motif-containing protein 5 [Diplonema papillatum]|nr:LYR motif-containing protein 5 [Diplonema papillatum]
MCGIGTVPCMHPRVFALYKQFMHLADYHPTKTKEQVRTMVRNKFLANKDLEVGSADWKRALGYGRYMVKEFEALIYLHKYRALKQRYREQE